MIGGLGEEDPIATEAAAWVVRLAQDDAGEAEWLSFAAWLDAEPEMGGVRRALFDRAQAIWLDADLLSQAVPSPQPGARRPARRESPSRRRTRIVQAAGAAAAVACAVVAIGVGWRLYSAPGSNLTSTTASTVYTTPPGVQRSVRLPDGSFIQMDGASQVRVASSDGRHIAFDRGEALFDVVHDPSRPFTVDAGRLQVRVLGTAFDIERDGATEAVAVARGAVRAATASEALRVTSGHSARVTVAGDLVLTPTSISDVGSWRQDRRLYRDRPLSEVVADLNRRYASPTEIDSEATGSMRFTGTLVFGPTREDTLRRLVVLLPLATRGGQGETVVLTSTSR